MAAEELIIDEWVIRLDGNIVELLHRTGLGYRYHVNHVEREGEGEELFTEARRRRERLA